MTRQHFLKKLLGLVVAPLAVPAWASAVTGDGQERVIDENIPKLEKPRSDWRRLLSPDQYKVLFKATTERPYSSPLNQEKRPGTFVCAACYLPLFDSATKYESGTGCPASTRRWRVTWAPRRTTGWFAPDRISLHPLRWSPGARVQGWASAHR